MRLLLTLSFFLVFAGAKAQGDEIIKLAFGSKDNFDLVPLLDMKLPAHNYVLSMTDKWSTHKFKINEDLNDPQIMQRIKNEPISIASYNVSTILSSKVIKQGFFFSVTEPIFTPDKQFAFIDIMIHHKEKGDTEEDRMLWGRVMLIYRYIQNKGWILIKKRTGPIF